MSNLNMMDTAKIKKSVFALTMLGAMAVAVSGCSDPKPADRAAPEFVVTTADDANEDIGKPCYHKILRF